MVVDDWDFCILFFGMQMETIRYILASRQVELIYWM